MSINTFTNHKGITKSFCNTCHKYIYDICVHLNTDEHKYMSKTYCKLCSKKFKKMYLHVKSKKHKELSNIHNTYKNHYATCTRIKILKPVVVKMTESTKELLLNDVKEKGIVDIICDYANEYHCNDHLYELSLFQIQILCWLFCIRQIRSKDKLINQLSGRRIFFARKIIKRLFPKNFPVYNIKVQGLNVIYINKNLQIYYKQIHPYFNKFSIKYINYKGKLTKTWFGNYSDEVKQEFKMTQDFLRSKISIPKQK